MLDCKPATTPIASRAQLSNQDGTLLSDSIEFRNFLGSLQYLTLTRLDIAFAYIAQFMARSTMTHLIVVKRVLCYVKGSLDLGLVFQPHRGPLVLRGSSDAD